MEKNIHMPKLRPEMKSGVLCAWLKEEGETVSAGEPLFEIETDKVVNQIEATVAQPYLIANPDLVLCDATFPEDRLYKDTAIAVPKGNEDFIEIINETIAECQEAGLIDQWIEEYSAICAENNKAA